MPLALRFSPPIGGVLYWLRPGTVRLPPWPDKVPLTRGFRRTVLDVALYAAVLAVGLFLFFSDGDPEGVRLDTTWIAVLLGLLALLGPARQGPVPRRAPRGLRVHAARLAVPGRRT